MRELYHDKSVPSFVKTNKVAIISKTKKSATDVSEKRKYENSESIIDSLLRIFEPDYKPEEDINIEDNFSISNQPELVKQPAKKRKKNLLD